jgi:uncharacterized membrane protein
LVERSVRDREVVGSNPAIPTSPRRARKAPGPPFSTKDTMELFDSAMHWLGYGLCHQIPARSLFGGGVQLPVCARDTGIYVGFVLSLLVMAALDRGRRRSELPPMPVLAIGGALVLAMAWDGVTSYAGLRATSNDLRLATGLMCGWALPMVVVPLLNSQLWSRSDPGRVLGGWREVVVWLAALPLSFAVVRWGMPLTGVVYPVFVAACIIATFVAVNAIVVTLAPRLERRFASLSGAWPVWAFSLAMGVAEVGAAAWLRTWVQSLVSVR